MSVAGSGPDPVFSSEPLAAEAEAAGVSDGVVVEVVWVAPAEWPPAPAGFRPPGRWAPHPDWPEVRHWTFWQVRGPVEAVERYVNTPLPGPTSEMAEGRVPSAVRVSTPAGRLAELNGWEHMLRGLARMRVGDGSAEELATGTGMVLAPAEAERHALAVAVEACVESAAAARDHLLYAIEHDRELDAGYFGWKEAFDERWKTQLDATERLSRARWDGATPAGVVPQPWSGGGSPLALPGSAWQRAEDVAAAALRQFGFDDARTTTGGADKGLDVEGSTVAAQVKFTAKPVGRPVLQQLVGAAGGRVTACFARAGFSAHALSYAEEVGMALFVVQLPGTVRPVSSAARQMTGSR